MPGPRLPARTAAIRSGSKTYVGKPCRKGHDGTRYTSAKQCVACSGTIKRTAKQRRSVALKTHYGITLEQFEKMRADQGGACAICRKAPSPEAHANQRVLNIDHCHRTGKVRGLLCSACNRALGAFGDEEGLLQAALDYLRR